MARYTGFAASALAAAIFAATGSADTSDWATATASPAAAAAATVLTLKLHYEVTCGNPGPGPVVVRLPRAFRMRGVPEVRLGRLSAPMVTTSGHSVTIALPRPPEITCMSITPGTLALVFVEGLVNPSSGGVYRVSAHLPGHTFTASLAIRA